MSYYQKVCQKVWSITKGKKTEVSFSKEQSWTFNFENIPKITVQNKIMHEQKAQILLNRTEAQKKRAQILLKRILKESLLLMVLTA